MIRKERQSLSVLRHPPSQRFFFCKYHIHITIFLLVSISYLQLRSVLQSLIHSLYLSHICDHWFIILLSYVYRAMYIFSSSIIPTKCVFAKNQVNIDFFYFNRRQLFELKIQKIFFCARTLMVNQNQKKNFCCSFFEIKPYWTTIQVKLWGYHST